MNALIISFLASVSASTCNLMFRRSSHHHVSKGYNYYLLTYFIVSFIFTLWLSPTVEKGPFDLTVFSLGCIVGALNMSMLWCTSRALSIGPSGLTFAFQNSSGIFPGIVMFLIFGPAFGFNMTISQLLGMLLILFGLYLGASNGPISSKWLKYAISCFLLQIFAFSLIHWRCLLYANDLDSHVLIPWNLSDCSDAWFLPGQFATAMLCQLGIVLFKERRFWHSSELFYGSLGGITNAIASLCLLIATKISLPLEKGLIFPIFAASTVILCNSWAKFLYQERFNLQANACCVLGIILGSLD